MGSMPYEEYFPCTMELEQMEKDDPKMIDTYRELICHFYICMDVLRECERDKGLGGLSISSFGRCFGRSLISDIRRRYQLEDGIQ